MTRTRVLTIAAAIIAFTAVARTQSGTADGVSAMARGDFQRAAEILQPIAEAGRTPDPVAQFFMATLYESGHGVPPDPLRACALFQAAMTTGSPFAEQAGMLHRGLLLSHDSEWMEQCSVLANLGFNQQFMPATFTLGPAHIVTWDLAGATVSYQGKENRIHVRVASRGAVFLPLRHTKLATTALRPESHDYIELFVWQPSGDKWNLEWFLYEVVQADLSLVVSESPVMSVTTREPPATAAFDARTLIDLHVNENGIAEYSVLSGARPRTHLIVSEAEKREDRERERARAAADARVDWSLVRDPHRQPAMTYVDADGCGNFLVYGWTDDRTEIITFRADDGALHLSRRAPSTFEIGDMGRSFSLGIRVYERPLRRAFCSSAGGPSPPVSPPGELWRAVAGSVTIELTPRGVRARTPDRYLATVRIVKAQFVNQAGARIRQTRPIMLTAMVGRVAGLGVF